MSGTTTNRSETARKARLKGLEKLDKRFKQEAKELIKTNPNMIFDDAFALRKDEYYQKIAVKMAATRKAKKAETKAKKAETKLLNFADNIGKQVVYDALITFANKLGNLTALTMPGTNDQFERRLKVDQLFLVERNATRRKVIEGNFSDWVAADVAHVIKGSFPFKGQKPEDFWDKISPRLNFMWFDFMGAYLKKYSQEFNQLFANSEQKEIVFAVTIGSRGRRGKALYINEVEEELESLFSLNGWQKTAFVSCVYKSENGTKMTTFIYSITRAETGQSKQCQELKDEIHRLQFELHKLENGSTKVKKTKVKKTRKPYSITPETATARANKAWETRRANAAKKAAKK